MKLSVHKRYTKAPTVTEKAFETKVYITDRQRSILRDAWHRAGKPFIVAPGYNEFLNALGVTLPHSDIVAIGRQGWSPKRLFGVDFGLPQSLDLDPELLYCGMDNIIKNQDGSTIIFNGGNPLPGCPNDWEEAKKIEAELNSQHEKDYPQWIFDCGFKLDFDCGLVKVSSRFYPPTTHGGDKWDGTVNVEILGSRLISKKIESTTVDQLRYEVDKYIQSIVDKITTINWSSL